MGGRDMEYRRVGGAGLVVSALGFGTATFGGKPPFFSNWGTTDVAEATRLVDVAIEAGVTLFDSADSYSEGLAEEFLGRALVGKRDRVLIATKANSRSAPGPNGHGSSRHHLINACEASLRRLRTDYIDLYQLHGFDALSPVEETLRALDDLVRSGKVRYIGCSNFSGWHLMKSLALSEKHRLARHVSHQVFYSLIGREYEWELLPLAVDQGVGTIVWSPLAGGRLTGKVRRGQAAPAGTRVGLGAAGALRVPEEHLHDVLDALDGVALETGKTVAQIALRWLLQRPTVASVIVGARSAAQLRENLGAVGWQLTGDQMARLDAASAIPPIYPYWHQRTAGAARNPPLIP
jgi:aryl-alcohol dehydrogenase-like predicted oxidoreductase